MRVRNKLDGGTFVAELDLRRMGNHHSDYVLLLHDDYAGADLAMGRFAASLGYELVEATPEEWAALLLAGFRLPRNSPKHARVPRLITLLQAAKRKEHHIKRRKRTDTALVEVPLKHATDTRRPRKSAFAGSGPARKMHPATGGYRHAGRSSVFAAPQPMMKRKEAPNPDC
jgi:hypothetical protein